MRYLSVLLLVLLAGRGVASPEGELIGKVWAGHPVSFALIVERGHQFIAYYDADRRLTVLGRKIGEATWTRAQPPGVPTARDRDSNFTGWDSHNYLRLALDHSGTLHLSGNMHVDPLVYYRTEKPFDLATLQRFDRMTGDREEHCTYPVFFKTAAGDLLFRYRDGSSGNGSDLYNVYDPAKQSWRRLLDTALLDGQGQRNAYALEPVLGPDGWFHLVWMWRDTPDCATNHSISYARSRDFVHWETSRGVALKLPITLATGEVIDPVPPGGGLINMTFALGFDQAKRPLVVYHRYDDAAHSQAYVARPSKAATGWDTRAISTWNFKWMFSGFGSVPAEVILGAPKPAADGSLQADFSSRVAGEGRWILDAATLETKATLPAPPPALPEDLARPSEAGKEVQTVVVRAEGRRWVLRWETLPRNRDQPRDTIPAPSELRLYELPDAETSAAVRVGS